MFLYISEVFNDCKKILNAPNLPQTGYGSALHIVDVELFLTNKLSKTYYYNSVLCDLKKKSSY